MSKRKYPFSMFCMGTILNLFKMWPCFIVVIIVAIICLVKPVIPIAIPLVLLGILVLTAIIKQYKNKKILLSHFEDKKADELLDKMFSNNSKGYKNVTDAVDDIINNYKNDSNQ